MPHSHKRSPAALSAYKRRNRAKIKRRYRANRAANLRLVLQLSQPEGAPPAPTRVTIDEWKTVHRGKWITVAFSMLVAEARRLYSSLDSTSNLDGD